MPLVHAAERLLGRALPMDLRGRLCRDNGGAVAADGDSWHLFPIPDPTDRRRLKRTANHIVRATRLARARPDFPADAVAIAEDGGGNYLILPAGSDDVAAWDGATGEARPVAVDWGWPRPSRLNPRRPRRRRGRGTRRGRRG